MEFERQGREEQRVEQAVQQRAFLFFFVLWWCLCFYFGNGCFDGMEGSHGLLK